MDLITEILMPAQTTKFLPGVRWSNVETRKVYASIWAASQWVAVGEGGMIITSPDGESWTQRNSGTSVDLKGISFSAGTLMVVGNAVSLISTDRGQSWSIKTSFPKGSLLISVGNLNCCSWIGDSFLVGGNASFIGLISSDGLSYTEFSKPSSSFNIYGALKHGSLYVAVGSGSTTTNIYTSSAGSTWTGISSGASALRGLASSGDLLVAVGDGGTILTSSTGATWTSRSSGVTSNLLGVIWTGTQFIAFGVNGVVLTSTDGVTWSKRAEGATSSFGTAFSTDINCAAWSDSKLMAFASTGFMLGSTSALSWSDSGALVLPDVGDGTTTDLIFAGGCYLAKGGFSSSGSYPIYKSVDGKRWTSNHCGATDSVGCFAGSGSLIVAVASNGYAHLSSDGVTWEAVKFADYCDFQKIIWDGAKFIAFGGGRLQSDHVQRNYGVWTSTNGYSWQYVADLARPDGSTPLIVDAVYSGSLYVALDNLKRVFKSSDLTNWTAVDLYSDLRVLKAIAWTGAYFVVVTSNSGSTTTGVMVSTDGSVWDSRGKIGTYALNDVTWTGKSLIAVGNSGLIWIFTDIAANKFAIRASSTSNNLLQVAGSSSHIIALGKSTNFTNICRSS